MTHFFYTIALNRVVSPESQDLVYVLRSKFKLAFSYFNVLIPEKKCNSLSRNAMIQMVKLPLIQIEICLIVELTGIAFLIGISENLMLFFYKKIPKYNSQHTCLHLKFPVLSLSCVPICYPLKLIENLIIERFVLPAHTSIKKKSYTSIYKLIPRQGKSKKKVHFRHVAAQLIQGFGLCSTASLTTNHWIRWNSGLFQYVI